MLSEENNSFHNLSAVMRQTVDVFAQAAELNALVIAVMIPPNHFPVIWAHPGTVLNASWKTDGGHPTPAARLHAEIEALDAGQPLAKTCPTPC